MIRRFFTNIPYLTYGRDATGCGLMAISKNAILVDTVSSTEKGLEPITFRQTVRNIKLLLQVITLCLPFRGVMFLFAPSDLRMKKNAASLKRRFQ